MKGDKKMKINKKKEKQLDEEKQTKTMYYDLFKMYIKSLDMIIPKLSKDDKERCMYELLEKVVEEINKAKMNEDEML